MGKKPTSSTQPAGDNAAGASAGAGSGLSLNATAKFAVLDAPGITQSVPPPATASAAASAAASSGGGKVADGSAATTGGGPGGGLQGRRAKAGAGPRMEAQSGGGGEEEEAILIGGGSFLERTRMPGWIKVRHMLGWHLSAAMARANHRCTRIVLFQLRRIANNATQIHAYIHLSQCTHFFSLPFASCNTPSQQDREEIYATIATRRHAELATKSPQPISVTLPDGTTLTTNPKTGIEFMSWKTSPYDVAAAISQGLADSSVVARVTYQDYVADYDPKEDGVGGGDVLMGEGGNDSDNEGEEEAVGDEQGKIKPVLWDLTRPLVGNVSKLELLKFDSDGTDGTDAKTVFWHSSAHMLGEALEHLYGCRLTIGPPLAGGFYYDSYMGVGTDATLKDEDYKPIEQEVAKIVKSKQKFERLVVTKEEALELFEGNPFKVSIISAKVPDNSRTTVYRCGDLIDLCQGPHLAHTGKVKAFAATRHSATNWLGDTDNDSLQRMYGISFPDKKMLKVWKENQEKVRYFVIVMHMSIEWDPQAVMRINVRISLSDTG